MASNPSADYEALPVPPHEEGNLFPQNKWALPQKKCAAVVIATALASTTGLMMWSSQVNHATELLTVAVNGHSYTLLGGDCLTPTIGENFMTYDMHECAAHCTSLPECVGFTLEGSPDGCARCFARKATCTNPVSPEEAPGCGGSSFWQAELRAFGEWFALENIVSGGSDIQHTVGTETNHAVSGELSTQVSTTVKAGFHTPGIQWGVSGTVGRTMTTSSSFSQTASASTTRTDHFVATPNGKFLWQWRFTYYRNEVEMGKSYTTSYAQTEGAWEKPACLPGYATDPMNGAQNCYQSQYRIQYR